jgi:glutathione-regulated potassium-efflux system ancillary protein KefG
MLFAHPNLEKSRVNRAMLKAIDDIPGLRIHDLYQQYPDFDIDIDNEKKALADADVLLIHHPFFWYNTPPMVKQWIDLVLQHGWAYGSKGKALVGKGWFHTTTTGGKAEAYQTEGYNRFTIRQFLASYEQTSRLCGTHFFDPIVLHGTHRLDAQAIDEAAIRYRNFLKALTASENNPESHAAIIASNTPLNHERETNP